ncbi:tetratricopeptide repeat protein [Candidatus Eisenbacteria bacterium]|uniref:Tetratricopeptide repeat protein n=1 Tax=Eiseniibacteriota bacterium TaxID=2212470 RepID=A0ABV6YM45_UNCEI
MHDVYLQHGKATRTFSRREFAEAIRLLEPLVVRSPGSGGLHGSLAQAYLGMGRFEDAEASFKRSLESMPDDRQFLLGLAESLRRNNKHREALLFYERVLALSPQSIEAHRGLGMAHTALGNSEQAREHFLRHVELNPNSPEALPRKRAACIGLVYYPWIR